MTAATLISLVGFYDSWTVRKHRNQKYVYDHRALILFDSNSWVLSITVGPILPGEGIVTVNFESEARPVLPKAPGVLAKALKPRLVLIF